MSLNMDEISLFVMFFNHTTRNEAENMRKKNGLNAESIQALKTQKRSLANFAKARSLSLLFPSGVGCFGLLAR